MNTSTNTTTNQIDLQPEAVTELTLALDLVIRELAIVPPSTVSIFFDGSEVYRHQTQEGKIFWWGTGCSSTFAVNPVSLVSSN